MTTCVFRYCKNSSRNIGTSSGVTFHRFVHPGHLKREEWIKILQEDRSEDTWLPTKYSFICSVHFKNRDTYMTKAGKRFLKKTAIPCSNTSSNILADTNLQVSTTSIDKMLISDSESFFDKTRNNQLKKKLKRVCAEKMVMAKKNIKLQQQNKYLKKKNESLKAVVKKLIEKFGINKQKE